MPVRTVTLTGAGATGIGIQGLKAFAATPVMVKLGRNPPTKASRAPLFGSYFATAKFVPPAELDYYTKAKISLDRMYANDRYGCCVISGKAHNVGVYSAHDSDSPEVVLCSDDEIVSEYQRICGRGDNGCNIDSVLRNMMSGGIRQGGKVRKIDGYTRINWMNPLEVKAAIYLFGAVTVGFYLPNSWANTDVWDITSSRIVGGHDVSIVGWKANGNYVVSSWGRLYEWTARAFHSNNYIDEAYAILAPEWYNSDRISPAQVDVTGLRKALEQLGGGVVPDVPDPEPEPQPEPQPEPLPPPPPPPPTKYAVTMTGNFPSGIWGKTVPVTITGTAVPTTSMTFSCDLDNPTVVPNWGFTYSPAHQSDFITRGPTMAEDFVGDNFKMVCLGADNVAVPWDAIANLLSKIIPVILADVAAGKSAGEIIEDVLRVLTEAKKMSEKGRERILTPEQWARLFEWVLKIIPLFL